MNKTLGRLLGLASLVTIVGVGLAACGNGPVATAQQQPASVTINSNQQGIWVNGEGKVTVAPDTAVLDLGVSAQASTVAQAQAQASTAMDKVMAALTSNGVDKKDIQTQYFSIQQSYLPIPVPALPPSPSDGTGAGTSSSPSIPVRPTLGPTGYQVSNSVTVKVRAVDKTGAIIDAVAAAGGDLVRVNGVSFSVDQPEKYYTQARQSAMSDAKAKADQLAKLAGVTLGKATYISEGSTAPVPYRQAFSGGAIAPSAATSISPGQTDIVIDVQVAYATQ